jgi:nitrous oxide reductase accessory protein NosL
VFIAGVALVAYRWEGSKQPLVCQICGRDVMKQTEFHVETTDGPLTACCPRCAMHYMLDHPDQVRGARATDYASGRVIDAKTAFYDEGGDVQYCTLHQPTVERGPNDGVRERVYDRCLPVLVAFASREEADTYRQQHGGRVLTYQQALESVREH